MPKRGRQALAGKSGAFAGKLPPGGYSPPLAGQGSEPLYEATRAMRLGAMPNLSAPARRSFLIGAAALLMMRSAHARVGMPEGAEPSPVQRRFSKVIERYAELARLETKQEKREALVVERGRELQAALGNGMTFTRWLGVLLTRTKVAQQGYFLHFVVLSNPRGVTAGFSNLDLRPAKSTGAIDPTWPMASTIETLPDGGLALLSGELFWDDRIGLADGMPVAPKSDTNLFNSSSFVARFDAIERPVWLEDIEAQTQRR